MAEEALESCAGMAVDATLASEEIFVAPALSNEVAMTEAWERIELPWVPAAFAALEAKETACEAKLGAAVAAIEVAPSKIDFKS